MIAKNPETPREELNETKRDLNELKNEVLGPVDLVGFGPVLSSSAALKILESLNSLEETQTSEEETIDLDKETQSGMEKILDNSFEDIISEYNDQFPMGFEKLSTIEKIDRISLKIAIDIIKKDPSKLTAKKPLPIDKLTKKIADEIINETQKQKDILVNKANNKIINSINNLKSFGLSDGEQKKLLEFFKEKGIITQQKVESGDKFYGKNGILIGEEGKEEISTHRGRQAEAEASTPLLPFVGGPIIIPIMKTLSKGKSSKEKPSESNTQKPGTYERIKHAHTGIPFEWINTNKGKNEDSTETGDEGKASPTGGGGSRGGGFGGGARGVTGGGGSGFR